MSGDISVLASDIFFSLIFVVGIYVFHFMPDEGYRLLNYKIFFRILLRNWKHVSAFH